MRLWHQELISLLPRQQMQGQHRECCALRGNGWSKKHATVDYVFTHSPAKLFAYHMKIMQEMIRRGYKPDKIWCDIMYRGKKCECYNESIGFELNNNCNSLIYQEHDDNYLQECLDNLKGKGIILK